MGMRSAPPRGGFRTPGPPPTPSARREARARARGAPGLRRPPREQLLFAVSLALQFPFFSLRAPCGGVLDKPCRLWALTSESILSQMGTIDWNEKLILNQ